MNLAEKIDPVFDQWRMSRQRESGREKKGSVPNVDQTAGLCGPAALKAVLSSHGEDVSEKRLADLAGSDEAGTSGEGLARAARALGFKAEVRNDSTLGDLAREVKAGTPPIANWFSTDEGHYSTVTGVGKESVTLADPESGSRKSLPRDTFERVWFDFEGPTPAGKVIRKRMIIVHPLEKKSEAAPAGWYKGQLQSPATVKFKTEFQGIPISIDRPKGFIMTGSDSKGNAWARRYKFDYGFIPKTLGGDNDGLDVFIGPEKKAPYAYWVIQRKDDGSFDEYKIFLGFPDRDAATAAFRQHIPKKYFKGIITIKVEMMKAMLGKVNPDENIKRASALGFIDELGWLLRTST